MTHSASILHQLQQRSEVSFAEFMQLALYAPIGGYYTANLPKFGAKGDFITAPELTPLFAKTLANQCQQILKTINAPTILEFGAGSGKLCVELLRKLEALETLPENYYIIEVSGSLQQRQRQLILQEIPHLQERVKWLSSWPDKPFAGIILANEVLDAMPVHRFLKTESAVLESYIQVDGEGLHEVFKPCSNKKLKSYVERVLPPDLYPYQSEVNLFVESWLLECANCLTEGVILLIDYGFPRHEYYHPDRHQGTLMCHYQHQAHTNPFVHLGEQDITAHVDFTQAAEAAVAAGLHVAGYTNQAAFLLSNGLLSFLEEINDERALFRAKQAIKQLTQPSEMGELFKVIALTKNCDIPLQGFQLLDKRMSL